MANITDIREMKARIVVLGRRRRRQRMNNMIAAGLQGVEIYIVASTDAQALTMSMAKGVIQMGTQVTGQALALARGPKWGAPQRRSNRCDPRSFDRRADGRYAGMGGGT